MANNHMQAYINTHKLIKKLNNENQVVTHWHWSHEWWPPETRLKNFERSLLSAGLATIRGRVTMIYNITYLVFRNAPSENSIW